jgi:hypothetical protein
MGMMVTSRGNLKERIPGKALIQLNRQSRGAQVHAKLKIVQLQVHAKLKIVQLQVHAKLKIVQLQDP